MTDIDATLDVESLLVDAQGTHTLRALEAQLRGSGLTLGLDLAELDDGVTVADWIAAGAQGARSTFEDPADHLIAGLEATLANGKRLCVRPCPRRAAGPDLIALALGTADRLLRVERAWLRIHRSGAERPQLDPPAIDLDPPIGPDEARLLDAIAAELARA